MCLSFLYLPEESEAPEDEIQKRQHAQLLLCLTGAIDKCKAVLAEGARPKATP